jgi:hypothetical protein
MKKEYWMAGIGVVFLIVLLCAIFIKPETFEVKTFDIPTITTTPQITSSPTGVNTIMLKHPDDVPITQNLNINDNNDNKLRLDFINEDLSLTAKVYQNDKLLSPQPTINFITENMGSYWKFAIDIKGASGEYDVVLDIGDYSNINDISVYDDSFSLYGKYLIAFDDVKQQRTEMGIAPLNYTTSTYNVTSDKTAKTITISGCKDSCYLDPTINMIFNSTNAESKNIDQIDGAEQVFTGAFLFGGGSGAVSRRPAVVKIGNLQSFNGNISNATLVIHTIANYTNASNYMHTCYVLNTTNQSWVSSGFARDDLRNFTTSGIVNSTNCTAMDSNDTNMTFDVTSKVREDYALGINNITFYLNSTLPDSASPSGALFASHTNPTESFRPVLIINYFDFVGDYTIGDSIYNETSTEFSNQNFQINISFNANVSAVNATFNYNNTLHTTVVDSEVNTSLTSFSIDIATPEIYSNISITKSFFWNFTINYTNGSSTYDVSDTSTQTLNPALFFICNATHSIPYINFTFEDEETNAALLVNISDLFFNYTLGYSSRAFTYNSLNSRASYSFCFSSPFETVYSDTDYLYYLSGGYPQRKYSENHTLTNTTTNETLYLLATAGGQYVTFQVINLASQPIDDVLSEVFSSGTLMESDKTDDAGAVTFWLNPDQTYTFNFSKTGYNGYTSTFMPTQISYTIPLGTTETVNQTNVNIGIDYSFTPINTTLNNGTEYNFSFTIESDYYNLENAGFNLTNGSGYLINTSVCGGSFATGCTASILQNTADYNRIIMNYYWVVNSTHGGGHHFWWVHEQYIGNQSLLMIFKQDLSNLGSGWSDFTKAMISIMIIIVVIGGLAKITGSFAPVAILWELWAIIFLLETLEFLPIIVGAVPYFYTIVIGLLAGGYTYWDMRKG